MNIFTYTDYRKYLKDYFEFKKKSCSFFSHRYLCNKLGLKSSNFILLVIKGMRNISDDICIKLIDVFQLKDNEAEYFKYLVLFTHAKNNIDKNNYWKKMISLRPQRKNGYIDEAKFKCYDQWYNLAIREIITAMGKDIDYQKLAKQISPPISAKAAKESVNLLSELGMVKKNENGQFEKSDTIIETDPKVNSLAVFNYHKEMASLAKTNLINTKREERNFSSCTLDVSEDGYKMIVEMISDFREKLMEVCALDEKLERVYQLNLQLFPITTKLQKDLSSD